MKNTKRAVRRHHRDRMIAHANRLGWLHMSAAEQDMFARKNYNHLAKCSCWMCQNCRKRDGDTIQERRFYQSMNAGEMKSDSSIS